MPDVHNLLEDLKTVRDEAKLKIHLGSKEAQDEWAVLEKRWHTFKTRQSWVRAPTSQAAPSSSWALTSSMPTNVCDRRSKKT